MKTMVSGFFLMMVSIGWAQPADLKVMVDYHYRTTRSEGTFPYAVNSRLITDQSTSLYTIDHLRTMEAGIERESTSQVTIGIPVKTNSFVYKDLEQDQMYYPVLISLEEVIVKDGLEAIGPWTLSEEQVEVMGYNCQKAAMEFRGRYYVAYFIDEIPVSNGPWLFHGLPGLILKVESTDGVFTLEAHTIKIESSEPIGANPYADRETVSWEEFLRLYRRKYDEVRRNSMREWGPSRSLPKKTIMEYISN